MYRLVLIGLLFTIGCQSDRGSLFYRKPSRVDDPTLSIDEQQRRGRERYSYIEDGSLTPRAYVDRPGTTGR